MVVHSTSKMLAKMVGKSKSKVTNSAVHEASESFTVPQLRPGSPDMEQVLANILGPTASKKHSPMD